MKVMIMVVVVGIRKLEKKLWVLRDEDDEC